MLPLETIFPALKSGEYRITSPANPGYNCIAWAAGDNSVWWQPSLGYYWPKSQPRDTSIAALINAFKLLGFEECRDGALESGYEKLAIYSKEGEYQHAARQLGSSRWTSKLGKDVDIEHTLEGLEGEEYGMVTSFLRRPIN